MTGRTSAPGRGQTCKGYFMIFRLAPKKSYVSNKIHILFMFLQNMNKTLIYFVQVCVFVDQDRPALSSRPLCIKISCKL